jgi:hypothetical protein
LVKITGTCTRRLTIVLARGLALCHNGACAKVASPS